MDENRFWILAAKKISGELTSSETEELELLYKANPFFEQIGNEVESAVFNSNPANLENEQKIIEHLRSKFKMAGIEYESGLVPGNEQDSLAERKTVRHSYKTQVILFSFFFLLASLILSWNFIFKNAAGKEKELPISSNNISTKPGSKSQIKLPDGTLVMLNADSKLSYPDNFVGNTRDVTLEGEAFFEVTENKSRPFIIHLKSMDVKVLGTVFNVKAYPGEATTEASLIKGSIEVTLKNRRDEKILLKPNEKITVSNTSLEQKTEGSQAKKATDANTHLISLDKVAYDEADSIVNEIAWTQNKLVFNNERFDNIVLLLERWFDKKIVIKTESLKELHFTGKFNNETIDQVLQALQLSHKFNYKRENDIIIIY